MLRTAAGSTTAPPEGEARFIYPPITERRCPVSLTVDDIMAECRNEFLLELREGRFRFDEAGGCSPSPLPGNARIRLHTMNGETLAEGWTDPEGRLPGAPEGLFEGWIRVMQPPESFLALCREITETHGGRIWIRGNDPEEGITVFMALPDRE